MYPWCPTSCPIQVRYAPAQTGKRHQFRHKPKPSAAKIGAAMRTVASSAVQTIANKDNGNSGGPPPSPSDVLATPKICDLVDQADDDKRRGDGKQSVFQSRILATSDGKADRDNRSRQQQPADTELEPLRGRISQHRLDSCTHRKAAQQVNQEDRALVVPPGRHVLVVGGIRSIKTG